MHNVRVAALHCCVTSRGNFIWKQPQKANDGIIFLLNWDSEPCFYGENTEKLMVIDLEVNRPALALFCSS